MTIKQMKDALREMKKVCSYEDSKTFISARGGADPCMHENDVVYLTTEINQISVSMCKHINRKK